MFEFVVGMLASPFIAYLVYVYATIGKRIFNSVLNDKQKSIAQKAVSTLLAIIIALVPMLLVLPLLRHVAIMLGLIVGCFFLFLFTRKPRSPH